MKDKLLINKTMDIKDIKSEEAKVIIEDINQLIKELKDKKLKISSWYGMFELPGDLKEFEKINRGYGYKSWPGAEDDKNFPWFLYWEIVWVVLNNEFLKHQKILDLGGTSSLFTFYLASKGYDVTTVEIQKDLVDNANFVAERMNWNLKNYVMDMRYMHFDFQFDHVTSICVYEHIPMYDRVEINQKIQEYLIPGGKFSLTFDYKNPARFARISSPNDVYEQFIEPSGLEVRGNKEFMDNGKNYLLHPFYYKKRLWKTKIFSIRRRHFYPWEIFKIKKENDYTFGALFLKKP